MIGEVRTEMQTPIEAGVGVESAAVQSSADVGSERERIGPDGRRNARWSIRRRVVVAVGIVICGLVLYYLVSLWQVWSTGRSDEARPVDAIVVMGAAQYDGRPSPQLAARLDHVVDLWPDGIAEFVVVTGGNRPGDRFTEAGTSARYLVDRGIPESAILREDTGSTSYESLERAADLLAASIGDDDRPKVLVVTDPYHALRAELIADEVGLVAFVSPADGSVVRGVNSVRRHLVEAGGVAVGRVTGFEWLSGLTD